MSIPTKRKDAMEDNKATKRPKIECPYGDKCFRLNPIHFKEYSHEHLESILDSYTGSGDFPIPAKLFSQKQMYVDQLKMIIHKQLYAPGKNFGNDQGCRRELVMALRLRSGHIPSKEFGFLMKKVTSPNCEECGVVEDVQHVLMECVRNEALRFNLLGPINRYDIGECNAILACPLSEQARILYKLAFFVLNTSSAGLEDSSSKPEQKSTEDKNKEDTSRLQVKQSDKSKTPMRTGETSKKSDSRSAESSKRSESRSGESSTMQGSRSGGSSTASSSGSSSKKDSDYRPIVNPTRRAEDFLSVVRPKGKMAAKHAASAPYHIFYTTITDCKETHAQPYSITFQEILDRSLGELKCSLQINFMVEIGWLLAQYYFAGYSEKKLTILYGEDCSDLKNINKKKPQVDAHYVTMSTPFGKHHTKMMILCYEDGSLRVVISTANLYLDDWENRTQGLWFSPSCPELPPDAMPHDGESPTMFKKCLLRYLNHYHLPQLAFYVERVKRCDFSHINVFLVASVPGSHFDLDWGMTRVGTLLRQHCCVPADVTRQWPLVAQASSIGSYGKEPKLWLTGDFLHNFTKIKNQSQLLSSPPELKIVYPSLENVRQSHDNLLGGGCLPYAADAHAKQPWLNDFLYQWQAKSSNRNKAMPHIKSYTRYSNNKAAYYLLTSANVSKAAWGQLNKGNGALRIMSYEAGVLFLPQFVIKEDFFPLQQSAKNRLVIPYDLPPIKYTPEMSVWVQDYLR